MSEIQEIKIENIETINNVTICKDFDSILDFLNLLSPDFRKVIITELEKNSDYVISFFNVDTIGYLGFYKRGNIENTYLFIFNKAEDMINYLKENPIHISHNEVIIKMLRKIQ